MLSNKARQARGVLLVRVNANGDVLSRKIAWETKCLLLIPTNLLSWTERSTFLSHEEGRGAVEPTDPHRYKVAMFRETSRNLDPKERLKKALREELGEKLVNNEKKLVATCSANGSANPLYIVLTRTPLDEKHGHEHKGAGELYPKQFKFDTIPKIMILVLRGEQGRGSKLKNDFQVRTQVHPMNDAPSI